MSKELIKALLQIGVSLLGKLIPALGGLLGGPLGWLAGLAISYLSGLLYDWVERLARFAAIDHQVQADLNLAIASNQALAIVQNNPNATKEEHDKAIADFISAHRTLGKFRV